MLKVLIIQLNNKGIPERAFVYSRWPREIPALLDRVALGYNMAHTQVYVNGKLAAGVGFNG